MSIFRLRFLIYILMVALAVQKLTRDANISPSSKVSTEELETNNLDDTNSTSTSVLSKPKAKPKKAVNYIIPHSSEELITKKAKQELARTSPASPKSLKISTIIPEVSIASDLPSTQLWDSAQKVVLPTVVSPPPQSIATNIAVPRTEVTSAQILAQKDSLMSVVESSPQQVVATRLADVNNHNVDDLQGIPSLNQSGMLLSRDAPTREATVNRQPGDVTAQATSLPTDPQQAQPVAAAIGVQKNLVGERGNYVEEEPQRREILFEQESISSSDSLNSELRPTTPTPPPPFTVALSQTESHRFNQPLIEPLTTDFPSSPSATLKALGTENRMTSASSLQVETLQAASLPSMAQRQIPSVAQASMLAKLQSRTAQDLDGVLPLNQSALLPRNHTIPTRQETVNPQQSGRVVAQGTQTPSRPDVERLQNELRTLEEVRNKSAFQASPALSVVIPTGFGLDNNTGFISAAYQQRTRDISGFSDGGLGVGIGLGDARKLVGVELSYTTASFGSSRDFGSGGFNVKVHRQLGNDWAVAAGWNGFLNIGDDNDFENSVYGVVTKVIRTRDNINSPLSRIALTAGVGSGQFRTERAVTNDSGGVNVFGNIAVRVAQPISLIAEWSGQDLGVGLSIAPFKNIPLVITPAVRDLAGAGDEPRFVLGTGFAFRF